MKNHFLNSAAFVLIAIGGINWGFYGVFGWDVIASIFGEMSMTMRVIDLLIGLAGVYRLALWVEMARSNHKKGE